MKSSPSLPAKPQPDLTLPCKHRGEGGAGGLDFKIARLFSSFVETPQSKAFPGKNAGRKKVWLVIGGGGDAFILPQTWDTTRVDI